MAKCSHCQFNGSYEGYLEHVCQATGHAPTEVEHQDALTNGRFSRQAQKAVERGQSH